MPGVDALIAELETLSFNNKYLALAESGQTQSLRIAPVLAGDTDTDGDVDDSDRGNAISNFTGPVGDSGGKFFGDGDVDDTDLGFAISGFTGPLALASVLEPGRCRRSWWPARSPRAVGDEPGRVLACHA